MTKERMACKLWLYHFEGCYVAIKNIIRKLM